MVVVPAAAPEAYAGAPAVQAVEPERLEGLRVAAGVSPAVLRAAGLVPSRAFPLRLVSRLTPKLSDPGHRDELRFYHESTR